MKRVEPTQSLLQGMPYTCAAQTDIKARFEAIRNQQKRQAVLLVVKKEKTK